MGPWTGVSLTPPRRRRERTSSTRFRVATSMRWKFIVPTRTCRVCSLLRFDGKKWCFSRLSDSSSPLPFPDRSFFNRFKRSASIQMTRLGRRMQRATIGVIYTSGEIAIATQPATCTRTPGAGAWSLEHASAFVWLARMDRMQNSAPSWITGVRHLESRFASRDYSIAKHLYMHINTNPSEVCSEKLWELGRFPCSFRCRSVWILKLVAVLVVALDTSSPIATNCGDVLVLRPRRKERPLGPPPHVVCCATTASSRACRGWGFPRLVCLTAEPSSLGTPPTLDVTVCMWRSNRWLN